MLKMYRSALIASTVLTAAFSAPTYAQDNTQNAISQLTEVITVNARKKSDVEDVQSVPVSVAAFNSGTLETLKVRNLQDLTFSAPNVSLDDIGTNPGTANFSIRGLGVNSSIPSIDPTVGVFVDGVYLGVNNGVVFDTFDLDSVEVLRGPQGLLFGRNTTGGAVLVNTGNPTSDPSAKVRISYDGPVDSGRGGGNVIVQGVVSGPVVEDKLNVKFGAYYRDDSGYFQNLFDGENIGAQETTILRAAVEFFASENVRFLGKFEYMDSEGDSAVGQNRGLFSRDTFDASIDEPGFYDNRTLLGSLKTEIDVDFGDGLITNIFGYRKFDSDARTDIDALPAFLFHSDVALDQKQFSNELRYNGTFGQFEVTTGLYWFNQDVLYDEVRDLPPLSPLTFFGGGMQDHTVFGVFGQTDWNIAEDWVITLGLRWSYEEKDAAITYVRPRPACSVVAGTCPSSGTNPFIPGESNGFADEEDWSNLTPKVGVQYNQDWGQIYASWTRGFRSGGYNFRLTAPAAFEAFVMQTGSFAFDEEQVDAFELGAKFQTDDRKLTLNGAVFYTDISDMQREVNESSGASGVVQTILNTADARILGLEIDGRYAVTDNLLLTANFGWIDAQYTDVFANLDSSPDGLITQSDEDLALPRVPEITFGFGAVYDLDLGSGGNVVTTVNYQYRDEFAYTDNNFGFIQSADILSFNVAWNTPLEGMSVSIYGRNMLDTVQAGNDTQVPFGAPTPSIVGGTPLFVGPNSNLVNAAFDPNPQLGTFSPLARGRSLGVELTYDFF